MNLKEIIDNVLNEEEGGEVNIKAKECPEGFRPGRTYNNVSLGNTQ